MFRTLARASLYTLALSGLLLSGCSGSGDDDDDDATDGTPVELEATFSSINTNIFQPTCATSGCHGDGSKSGNLDMEGDLAYTNTVNVASSELSTMDRIEPGDPSNSYLWHKIENTAGQGSVGGVASQMPLGSSLTEDQKAVIEEWITAGAQNN